MIEQSVRDTFNAQKTSLQLIDDTVSLVAGVPVLKTIILDGSGNQVTSFGGTGSGGDASAANQTTMITSLQLIDDTVATIASAIPSKGLAIAGTDGTNARVLKTDTSGELQIDVLTMPTVTVNAHAVTNAGTFVVQENGAALTSLQLIDDTIATVASAITTKGVAIAGTDGTNARIIKTNTSGEVSVNVISAPTTAVTGTFWQATQPVSIASAVPINDNAGSITVDNGGTFAVQAAQSGTWNIGTITNVVHIDDNAGSITVDGTVAVSGTVTVGSHAVTNAGTFAVQVDGSALTSLQLIDDVIVASDTGLGSSTPKGAVMMGHYSSSPTKVSASDDAVSLKLTQEGKMLDVHSTVAADTTNINNSYASAQTNTSQQSAPGANKRIVVVEIIYSRDTAGTMKLVEDPAGTPATKFGAHYFPANGGMVATKCYVPLTANKALGLTSTGGGNETFTARTIIENV